MQPLSKEHYVDNFINYVPKTLLIADTITHELYEKLTALYS